MNARTLIGLLLLLVEAGALAGASGRVVHAAVPIAIAAVAGIADRRIRMSFERYLYALGGIGLAALLWWAVLPPRLDTPLHMFPVTGSALLYVMGVYCIWHQCFQLLVEVRQRFGSMTGPFPSFPFLGVFVVAIAGHYSFWATRHPGYAAVTLAFVALTALYYLARNGQWMFAAYSTGLKLFSLGLLACAVSAGTLMAVSIRQNETAINAMLDRLTFTSPADAALGFSREGRLSNITERRAATDQRPALFVTSDRVPGYLRGLVFDTYRNSRWNLPNPERWLGPTEAPDFASLPAFSRRYFQLTEEDVSEPVAQYEIFTADGLLDTVFLPAGAAGLFVNADSVGLDNANIVRETKPLRRPGYAAIESVTSAVRRPADADLARYLLVPALDPRVVDLAGEVTAGASTPREKALAVERHFLENYDYELGIQVPLGEDPLTYFLLERPAAHCEYFATGAAILLRLAGVPARYVTGFVAVERNPAGDFYVARNKDAHAWVEAWDPESGWFMVEATPPAGVPEPRDAPVFSSFRDSISLALSRFRDRLGEDPFDAVVEAVSALADVLTRSMYGRVLLAASLGAAVVYLLRRRRKTRAGPSLPDDVRRLRMLVERADGIARSAGLVREENETVRHFAERLASMQPERQCQELAEWYRQYERVRYRDTADAGAYAYLESALPAVR